MERHPSERKWRSSCGRPQINNEEENGYLFYSNGARIKEGNENKKTEFRVCLSGAFDAAEAHVSAIILRAGHVRSRLKKRGKWKNV